MTHTTPLAEGHATSVADESRRYELDRWMRCLPLAVYEAVPSSAHFDLWSLLYASDGIQHITGYSPADFIDAQPRQYLFELIHPQDRARVGAHYDRSRVTQSAVNIRYRIRHATQGYRLVEERSTFHRDPDGRLHVFGALIDIAKPKRQTRLLADLDATLAHLNADVAVATGQEFIQHLCRRLALLTGVRQVGLFRVDRNRHLESLALVRDGLLQPSYCIGIEHSVFRSLLDQPRLTLTLDPENQDWEVLREISHITAIRLNNRQHQWLGVLALGSDAAIHTDNTLERVLELYSDRSVTEIERLSLEYQLQESEGRYRAFFETAVQAFLVVNAQGRVVNVNRAACRLFNLVPEQPPDALELVNIFPKRQPDGRRSLFHFLRLVRQSLSAPVEPSQWAVKTLTGEPKTVTVHAVPTVMNLSEQVMLSFEDVTAQLEAERALQAQNTFLSQRQGRLRGLVQLATRLEQQVDKDDFLKVVAEELSRRDSVMSVAHYDIAGKSWHPTVRDRSDVDLDLDTHRGAIEQACRDGQPLWIHAESNWLYFPLLDDARSVAVLVMECDDEDFEDQEFISLLLQTLNLSFDNLLQRHSLRLQAMRDSLTQLGNRAQLHEWIDESLQREPEQEASLALFDLNRFKEINDTLGHHFGDRLLCEIGPRLERVFASHERYRLARLGGDEFAIFMPSASPIQATAMAERLAECLSQPYTIDAMQLQVEASIGLSHYPDQGRDGHELLRCADVAMYAAKTAGRHLVVFDSALDASTPHRIVVLSELDQGLAEGQIWVAYQPVIRAGDGRVVGFEALVRWQHPLLGALAPADFIPIAEMGQGIRRITRFVLENSLQALVGWRELSPDLYMAVNLSARVLLDHALPKQVERLLQRFRLPGAALVLELTESTLLTDPLRAIDIINELEALGVKVAVDDFGTGYSSLAYLKSLPIHALKIDRSFIVDLLLDPQDRVIIESTIKMAHNLGLETIAEGVEEEATLVELMKMGCDAIQGYYFSKPISRTDMDAWLSRNL